MLPMPEKFFKINITSERARDKIQTDKHTNTLFKGRVASLHKW